MEKDPFKYALKYIAASPKSAAQLSRKLEDKGFSQDEAQRAVSRLRELGCLDDEKYALLLAESRVRNKGWGPLKIARDLSAKGIPDHVIEKTISSLDEAGTISAVKKAFSKWLRKNGLALPLDEAARAKAFRFLKGRGYDSSTAHETLKADKRRGKTEEC